MFFYSIQIFFDLVRQINKRTPVNRDKKNKGKSSVPNNNSNPTSTGKTSAMDGSENKQECCVLL